MRGSSATGGGSTLARASPSHPLAQYALPSATRLKPFVIAQYFEHEGEVRPAGPVTRVDEASRPSFRIRELQALVESLLAGTEDA